MKFTLSFSRWWFSKLVFSTQFDGCIFFSNWVGSTTNYSNNDSWFVHFGFSMVHKNSLDLLGQLGNALDQLFFETTRRSKISMAFCHPRESQSLG